MMKFIKIVFFTLCVYQLDSSRSRVEDEIQPPKSTSPSASLAEEPKAAVEDSADDDTSVENEGVTVEAGADPTEPAVDYCDDCNEKRKHSHAVGQYIIEHIHEHTTQHVHLIADLLNLADVHTTLEVIEKKPDQREHEDLVKYLKELFPYGRHFGGSKNYELYMHKIADMIEAHKESKKTSEKVFEDLEKVLYVVENQYIHTHTYNGETVKHNHHHIKPHRHQVVDGKLDPKSVYAREHDRAPHLNLVMTVAELFQDKPDDKLIHAFLWNYVESSLGEEAGKGDAEEVRKGDEEDGGETLEEDGSKGIWRWKGPWTPP